MITVTIATAASIQFVEAFPIALDARLSPIIIIIGPVTIGGKNFNTFLIPSHLNKPASIKYNRPATTMPPSAYASLSSALIAAYFPEFNAAIVENPPRYAKDEPKNAGTFHLVHKWKNKVPMPANSNVVYIFNGRP